MGNYIIPNGVSLEIQSHHNKTEPIITWILLMKVICLTQYICDGKTEKHDHDKEKHFTGHIGRAADKPELQQNI